MEPQTTEIVAGQGFVAREIRRLETALTTPGLDSARWGQVYAALQALYYVVEPSGYAAPWDTIAAGAVQPPGWDGSPLVPDGAPEFHGSIVPVPGDSSTGWAPLP